MNTPVAGDPQYCTEKTAAKVMYEYTMFTFLYGLLQFRCRESGAFQPGEITYLGTGVESDEDLRTTSALLESYLVHTRVLYDFFFKAPTRDDIVADHFVDKWTSLRRRPWFVPKPIEDA
jgi:hypothetical protein